MFAADESRIDAFLTAFGGSCIHPSTGFNRASLTELVVSSQYKMGRIMDGEKCIGRTIFRLLKVKLPNGYDGYALRMDKPVLPTNWSTSPDAFRSGGVDSLRSLCRLRNAPAKSRGTNRSETAGLFCK